MNAEQKQHQKLTYSAAETAAVLGISEATVRRAARIGALPVFRVRGSTRLLFPRLLINRIANGEMPPPEMP